MLEVNRIYQGDCLELMKELSDKSVDMAWFDPPYNVGKDYGVWNDNLSDTSYLKYVKLWTRECKRISNNRIAVLVPKKYHLQWWLYLGNDYREIQLTYSPEGAIRYGYVNQFSTILTNIKPVEYTKNVWHNCQMTGLGWFFRENTFGNPGYTSYDITKRIIYAFTQADQIILDPFLGSGTTAVAALRTGRRFIGIEISPEYCAIAQKRVDAELAQTKLDL